LPAKKKEDGGAVGTRGVRTPVDCVCSLFKAVDASLTSLDTVFRTPPRERGGGRLALGSEEAPSESDAELKAGSAAES
jgi:hypothetical protein